MPEPLNPVVALALDRYACDEQATDALRQDYTEIQIGDYTYLGR